MKEKRVRKALLIKVDDVVSNQFKSLCEDEGFNVTTALNIMIRKAIKSKKI